MLFANISELYLRVFFWSVGVPTYHIVTLPKNIFSSKTEVDLKHTDYFRANTELSNQTKKYNSMIFHQHLSSQSSVYRQRQLHHSKSRSFQVKLGYQAAGLKKDTDSGESKNAEYHI